MRSRHQQDRRHRPIWADGAATPHQERADAISTKGDDQHALAAEPVAEVPEDHPADREQQERHPRKSPVRRAAGRRPQLGRTTGGTPAPRRCRSGLVVPLQRRATKPATAATPRRFSAAGWRPPPRQRCCMAPDPRQTEAPGSCETPECELMQQCARRLNSRTARRSRSPTLPNQWPDC